MAEGETPGITSTQTVEAEIPPLRRVGYINRIKREKVEVSIRTYCEDREVKSYWIHVGDTPVMVILATKIEETSTGLWFYKHNELIGHLPLDEVEDST